MRLPRVTDEMKRAAGDLMIVAAAILAPASAGSLIAAAGAREGSALAAAAPAQDNVLSGGDARENKLQEATPWWIDGAAITIAFTATTAGIGVVGARLLELWQKYNEIRASSVLAKLDECERRVAERDVQIAFLTAANQQLRLIVHEQLASMVDSDPDPRPPKARGRPRPKPDPLPE